MLSKIIIVAISLMSLGIDPILGLEREMTINVDPGKNECFFHHVQLGGSIEIEYQVIDGGHGDLDISFMLSDPIGLVIVSDYKKSENLHRHEVRTAGDYRFCFDNTFSSFNRKTVFFGIVVDGDDTQNAGDGPAEHLSGLTQDEVYEMTVQDIMDYIGRIRMQMTKARQLQDLLRSYEARDRNLAEANFHKVNTWSFFQLIAMVLVGILQVFMLRSIFETNSRMSQFWKKLKL